MQLHELKPKIKKQDKKRIARGGKRGTTSGRGTKGQKSRSGHAIRPALREFLKKIPKMRGVKNLAAETKPQPVNIEKLEAHFDSGDKITPQALLEKGLVNPTKGKLPAVKLLGDGNITKKLLVENCQISKTAKEKIEKAGGEIK